MALSGGRPCFTPSLHKDRRFLKRRKQVSGANEDAREFSALSGLSGLSGGCSLEGLSLVACMSPLPRLQPEAKTRARGGGGWVRGLVGAMWVKDRVSVGPMGLKVLRSMFSPS